MYEELIRRLREEPLDSNKAALSIMDLCIDAATAIENLSHRLEMAQGERDAVTRHMIELEQEVCRLKSRLAAYEDTGLEPEEIKGFAEDVAYQFGYYFPIKDILYISTGGLSTLERAFRILGWNDPHPVPECECEFPGCHKHATCGTPTKDGYKRVCGKHFAELARGEEAEAALKGGEGL